MSRWLVTVKLPANPAHNPRRKLTGPCPVTGERCTDVTGAHHTALVTATTADEAAASMGDVFPHITRVEEV